MTDSPMSDSERESESEHRLDSLPIPKTGRLLGIDFGTVRVGG